MLSAPIHGDSHQHIWHLHFQHEKERNMCASPDVEDYNSVIPDKGIAGLVRVTNTEMRRSKLHDAVVNR